MLKARDLALDRQVAIKLMLDEAQGIDSEQFRREACWRNYRLTGIVPVHAADEVWWEGGQARRLDLTEIGGGCMADDSGEDREEPGELVDFIWAVLGFAAGVTLSAKYAQSIGLGPEDELPGIQAVVVIVLLTAPMCLFGVIAEQLSKEIKRGKITWATYWTTLFGVAVATFTLLGITGVDDLLNLWDSA